MTELTIRQGREYVAPEVRDLGGLAELTESSALFFGHSTGHADASLSGTSSPAPGSSGITSSPGAGTAPTGTTAPVAHGITHSGTSHSPTSHGSTHGSSGNPTSGGNGGYDPGAATHSSNGSSPQSTVQPVDLTKSVPAAAAGANTEGSLPFTGYAAGGAAALGVIGTTVGIALRRLTGRR